MHRRNLMTDAAMFAEHADSLRAYVETLRKGRGLSQAALARMSGVPYRSYRSWLSGETKLIKKDYADALVEALEGSLEHLGLLRRMTVAEAKHLAFDWMALSSSAQKEANAGLAEMRRIIELRDSDPEGFEILVQQLLREARENPKVIGWVSNALVLWRALPSQQ
jgi:transcriptional regulator with XRE-family HTH domain